MPKAKKKSVTARSAPVERPVTRASSQGENQQVEDVAGPSSDTLGRRRKPTLVILGDSIIYWSAVYATRHNHQSLGLDAGVVSRGIRGLKLHQRKLSEKIGKVLRRVQSLLPSVNVGWSCILPRVTYADFCPEDQPAIDRKRRSANRYARSACRHLMGFVLEHEGIRHDDLQLFRPDGVHLSEEGILVFLESLRNGLMDVI
nr:uncharacterized protein LOC129260682 [Lytechinus pictus]